MIFNFGSRAAVAKDKALTAKFFQVQSARTGKRMRFRQDREHAFIPHMQRAELSVSRDLRHKCHIRSALLN